MLRQTYVHCQYFSGRPIAKLHLQLGGGLLVRSATTISSSPEYQFLQQSKLPTMFFQKSLPRLPIPLLEKSCERFLNAVQPLLKPNEYAQTAQVVSDFRHGIGAELHTLLLQHDSANKHTSYISEPWFDMYLSDRAPLPFNYNPLLVMKPDTRPEYQAQVLRAANLVVSSLRFWRSLQANILEPEVYHMNAKKSDTATFRRWMQFMPQFMATYAAYAFKAFPLDMSQYQRLFGTTRIPSIGKDYLQHTANSRHILVMRRGNMYAVDVLDKYGSIEHANVILERLQAVLRLDESRGAAKVPLGPLTALNRDKWAHLRQHLATSINAINKQLLETEVDAALFCLCLDVDIEAVYNEADPVPLFKHMLGSNGINRWFDKSVSLLISTDGSAAVNFEHSWGDGVAVLRYFNEIYKETTTQPFLQPSTHPATQRSNENHVRAIDFTIDENIEANVNQAIALNNKTMQQLNMNILRSPQLNKVVCKDARVSPDAVMQLAFQVAYRRAFNDYVGTYESCSTAAFRHGRTEAIRPCTNATKEFCEALMLPATKQPQTNELRALINKCSNLHNKLTKDAAMGQGFDRHFFALKHMITSEGQSLPPLYETKAYKKINNNIISTSTLSSNALLAGAFGPVVRDGLGVGYSMQDDMCGAIVTSYEKLRDGKAFTDCLETAFKDIHNVLVPDAK